MTKKRLINSLIQFKYNIQNFVDSYILHKENCEYCKYFGGLMCAHIDENGKCLGFKRYYSNPIKNIFYRKKINKIVKAIRMGKLK